MIIFSFMFSGKSDHQEVFDEVKSLAAKWEQLAGRLHLSTDSIDIIARNNYGDVVGCLFSALKEWLKLEYNYVQYGRPSWKMLAESVRGLDNSLYEKFVDKFNIH